jgi:hypothetical protein
MAVITNPLDANGNIEVNLPTTVGQTGYAVLAGENHDGKAGLLTVVRRAAQVSQDGRLRVGVDSPYWQDNFNHAIADTSAYQMITATATLAMTGGYMVFNAGNSVAAGAVARVQTYRTFALNAGVSLRVSFRVRFPMALQANNAGEFGLGFAATTATPTDGVYFKLTTGGVLQGCLNINGTEQTTGLSGFVPTPNENNFYRIIVDQDVAKFFINDILYGQILVPATSAAVAFARSWPLLIRFFNNAATASAQRMEVSDVAVLGRDLNQMRDWETAQSGMEMGSYQNPRGAAVGQTANFVNSTAPVNATLSNVAAGYTTLGGQFGFAAVAGAATDYALFAYQVPVPAVAGGNKNLVINGIRIEALNTGAAVATTATVLQWSLGVGSTGVSLATADSATAGTRAPRRIPLGLQSFPVGAAIGAIATPIDVNLDAPVYVSAGTFLHVVLKMPIGTATAAQVIQGMVTINGFWE